MKVILPTIFLVSLAAFFVSASCTPKDALYRKHGGVWVDEQTSEKVDCSKPTTLVTEATQTKASLRSECYLSTYVLPGSDLWKNEAGYGKIQSPDRYSLSFVEMADTKDDLILPKQLDDLRASFSKSSQDIVFIYVHGWRHDAQLANKNVRQFHTMLGYARSALNVRCIETGNYCDAELTGVYLSWRGKAFREPDKGNYELPHPGAILAASTVWGRKKQSEVLASGIAERTLIDIQNSLDLDPNSFKSDKMLVVGHSFGGNMLAEVLKERAVKAVEGHQLGKAMPPLLGDLVVLINPAAEARKWIEIQRAEREKFSVLEGVNAVHSALSYPDGTQEKIKKWRGMYPIDQRPIYISITAAAGWSSIEKKNEFHDSATKTLFPLSRLAVLDFKRENRIAIGHYTPTHKKIATSNGDRAINVGEPVGQTHEIVTNASGRKAGTSYANSSNPEYSWCGDHSGWLYQARLRAVPPGEKATSNDGWDSSYSGSDAMRPLLNKMGGAETQIRHALYLEEFNHAESVVSGHNPFWNIRALDTAVAEHAGFWNFPLFCTINSLWLDNVTAPNYSAADDRGR